MIKKYCLLYVCLMAVTGSLSGAVFASAQITPSSSQPAVSSTPVNPFSGSYTSSPAPTPAPYAKGLILHENQLLSQEVKNWVAGNGYKLFWNSKKDYLIYNTISIAGKTDDEILQALGDLFFSENYGLVVKKYEKNRVIVVDEM